MNDVKDPCNVSAGSSPAPSSAPAQTETSAPGTAVTLREGEAGNHFQSTRQISCFIPPHNGSFPPFQMTIAPLEVKQCSKEQHRDRLPV